MAPSRRTALASGLAAAFALPGAGCLGGADGPDGYGAFFTLADWGRAVAGDHLRFESAVPLGRVGHGWEPDVEMATRIAAADVFLYPALPSFAWAQTAAEILERDYEGVETVDVLADVDLLPIEDGHDGHGGGSDADPGSVDPHAWVDPVRAQTMVATIAAGIRRADTGHADEYRSNVQAYVERLASLDSTFDTRLGAAPGDVVVLAGHNSFRYLAARYGFEIVTPQGISPDTSVSEGDIADTLEIVESHGIDTVLVDAFASDALARTILENSSATSIREVSPAEGTTEAWRDRGWGYLEQMEAVNLPAFEAGLDRS